MNEMRQFLIYQSEDGRTKIDVMRRGNSVAEPEAAHRIVR